MEEKITKAPKLDKRLSAIASMVNRAGKCGVRLADIAGKKIPCAFTVISPDEVELQMARGERISIKI